MKNIRLFFISVFLSAAASAFAGPATFEAQPSPTPADENHRDLLITDLDTPETVVSTTTTASLATAIRSTMTLATLIASSSPGSGISGQASNTSGSISM